MSLIYQREYYTAKTKIDESRNIFMRDMYMMKETSVEKRIFFKLQVENVEGIKNTTTRVIIKKNSFYIRNYGLYKQKRT